MKKSIHGATLLFLCVLWLAPSALAQVGPDIERERLGQTGMKFLSVPVDPRAAALGNAVTAQQLGALSLFTNPAGMAQMDGTVHVALSQVEWIGNYQYGAGSVAFQPGDGRYGTVGVSFVTVDYGNILATIRSDNAQGFEDVGTVTPSAFAIGVGYARALTDRFSVGGQVKYVHQSLGEAGLSYDGDGSLEMADNKVNVGAFDFGVLYKTGFRSLNIAMSARNFAQEVTYSEESFELPLTFRIGVSMDVTDLTPALGSTHDFVLSVDAERPRDYAEQLRVGGEYRFMNFFFLRGGYVLPTDEEGINLGGGVRLNVSGFTLSADYAYTEFGRFGNVNRIGFQIGF